MRNDIIFDHDEGSLLRQALEHRYAVLQKELPHAYTPFYEAIVTMPHMIAKMRLRKLFQDMNMDCGYVVPATVPVDDALVNSIRTQVNQLAKLHTEMMSNCLNHSRYYKPFIGVDAGEDMKVLAVFLNGNLHKVSFTTLNNTVRMLWGTQVFADMVGRGRRHLFKIHPYIQL